MAQMADSEAVIWRQAEKIRRQQQEYLIRRQGRRSHYRVGGDQIMQLPSSGAITTGVVIRVREPGGPVREPGSAR